MVNANFVAPFFLALCLHLRLRFLAALLYLLTSTCYHIISCGLVVPCFLHNTLLARYYHRRDTPCHFFAPFFSGRKLKLGLGQGLLEKIRNRKEIRNMARYSFFLSLYLSLLSPYLPLFYIFTFSSAPPTCTNPPPPGNDSWVGF